MYTNMSNDCTPYQMMTADQKLLNKMQAPTNKETLSIKFWFMVYLLQHLSLQLCIHALCTRIVSVQSF